MFSLLNIFRLIAFLEGVSYILLLFIAVPIKYLNNDPQYVKLLGMPHGLLFIGYIVLAIIIGSHLKWNSKIMRAVLLASIIPFGTFYIDKTYLKNAS
jgi:integral membrane protein